MASIQKYQLTLASGKTEPRWRAFHRDLSGKNVGKVFKTRRDADAWLKRHAGTKTDSEAAKQSLAVVWQEAHDRDYAPATIAIHESVWKHVGPSLGSKRIGDITRADVDAALKKIAAPGMRKKARSVLSGVLSFAMAQPHPGIDANPAKVIKRATTRAERMQDSARSGSAKKADRYLTEPQLAALVAATPENYRSLVRLMARMGLRPGEALALRVGKFNPLKRTLLIDASYNDETMTKTGEARTLILPVVVAEDLKRHINEFSSWDPNALVFPTRNGAMLNRSSFRHQFVRWSVKAGVNHGLSPNHLRHTAAAFAIGNGADVYGVMNLLGHARPSITLDIYGSLWDGSLEKLADKLDEAIRQSESA